MFPLMKKLLTIGLGILILATAIISNTEASREVYQRYINSRRTEDRKDRRMSDRIHPMNNRSRQRKHTRQFWKLRSIKKYPRSTNTVRPNPIPRPKVIIQSPELLRSPAYDILKRNEYRLNTPSTFKKDHNGIYRSSISSLSFQVVRTPENYECRQYFKYCATSLGKGFKRIQEIGDVTQDHKIVAVPKGYANYPVVVERFESNKFGQDVSYFVFNILDDSNRSVVRLEAITLKKNEYASAKILGKVFESLRLY